MVSRRALHVLATETRPEDFYRPSHGHIAAAMAAIHELQHDHGDGASPADPTTIAYELKCDGLLDLVGGPSALLELQIGTPATSNASRYAEIVRTTAEGRRKISRLGEAVEATYAGDDRKSIEVLQELALNAVAPGRLVDVLLTGDEIETIPPPEPLLGDLMFRKSLVVLYGKPASGKSLLALDWAASIASGSWWFGREVRAGQVLYVIAEGQDGLGARFRSWKSARGIHGVERIEWLPKPVNLFDPKAAAELVALASRRPYELVVIDTLARCTVGAAENDTGDMSRVVDVADRLRLAANGTVLLVHHTPRDGENPRGSTALEGAADTLILVRTTDGRLVVDCKKQKNAAEFPAIHLKIEAVGDSVALAKGSTDPESDERVSKRAADLMTILQRIDVGDGVSTKAWADAAKEWHDMSRTTFFAARKSLVGKELVEQIGEGQRAPWKLTEQARAALEPAKGSA